VSCFHFVDGVEPVDPKCLLPAVVLMHEFEEVPPEVGLLIFLNAITDFHPSGKEVGAPIPVKRPPRQQYKCDSRQISKTLTVCTTVQRSTSQWLQALILGDNERGSYVGSAAGMTEKLSSTCGSWSVFGACGMCKLRRCRSHTKLVSTVKSKTVDEIASWKTLPAFQLQLSEFESCGAATARVELVACGF
jgi:hypothetical protein